MLKLGKWLAVGALALGMTGCDPIKNVISPSPSPTPAPVIYTRPHLALYFCNSTSAAVPVEQRAAADREFTQVAQSLVTAAQPGAQLYAIPLTRDSFHAPAVSFKVPALALTTPVPPDIGRDGLNYKSRLRQYNTDVSNYNMALSKGHDAVNAGIAAYSKLAAPTVESADDWGCIKRASDLLRAEQGDKFLWIASDLESWLYADDGHSQDLAGVNVRVRQFCVDGHRCDERRSDWVACFRQLHATSIAFYAPGQSTDRLLDPGLPSPLSLDAGGSGDSAHTKVR